jgi:hypothetical protein
MLCLCPTLGQDGLTARLLVVRSGHLLGGEAGSRSLREGGVAAPGIGEEQVLAAPTCGPLL